MTPSTGPKAELADIWVYIWATSGQLGEVSVVRHSWPGDIQPYSWAMSGGGVTTLSSGRNKSNEEMNGLVVMAPSWKWTNPAAVVMPPERISELLPASNR